MKHLILAITAALALASCTTEPAADDPAADLAADTATTEAPIVRAMCSTRSQPICAGQVVESICANSPRVLRCFGSNELPDGTWSCVCTGADIK